MRRRVSSRRHDQRGAIALVGTFGTAMALVFVASAAGWQALVATQDRAQSLADSAVHAGVVAIAARGATEDLSVTLQQDAAACVVEPGGVDTPPSPQPVCVIAAGLVARLLAAQAGSSAALIELSFGADVRDMYAGVGAGHLTASVAVGLRRGLPGCGSAPPPVRGASICWAVAVASAEQAL